MGQTLKRAAQWTSARDGSGGKLEYTPLNQDILNAILQFVEAYSTQHLDEAQVIFKKALTWPTSLRPSNFVGSGYKDVGDDIISDETTENGDPMLALRYIRHVYVLNVFSLSHAARVISLTNDAKIKEVRACLEANRDPQVNICGERFATVDGEDNSLSRYIDELVRDSLQLAKDAEKEAGEKQETTAPVTTTDIQERQKLLNLRLQIARLDDQLLNMSVIRISQDARLAPDTVDEEVKALQALSGSDPDYHVLQNIKYYYIIDGYVYDNSCRAPPWRQVFGDICYLIVSPHDKIPINITANTAGYFVNGGQVESGNELNYEKQGEYYKSLAALIKDQSPKFEEIIGKQDFAVKRRDTQEQHIMVTNRDDVDGDDETVDKYQVHEVEQDKGHKHQTGERSKKLEPSLKWQTVQIEETKEQVDRQKEKKLKKKKMKSAHDKRLSIHGNYEVEDSFSESSTESEEEDDGSERRAEPNSDLPSEYWQIQKLVKYLKGGNQTATIISLCAMRDFSLDLETCQLAIRDVGGLEVLINLLDTAEVKCMIGALKILKEISKNPQIRRSIADLGGLQTMVTILRHPNKELKALAAETIANVAKFRRARRTVRQHGGIERLVSLMDCGSLHETNSETILNIEVARCGALALWSCSKSKKNKETMRKAGAIPLLAKLLKSNHENMLVPVVGTLQECATEGSYRLAIRTEGMVEDLVKNLHSQNHELQMHCASAIFKCAEDTETRELVRRFGGLDPLVALLNNFDNKDLLAAATGAIWKCSISHENVARFQELRAIDLLVSLLNNQPEEVLVNVVGALGEMAKDTPNRLQIRKAGGIPPMVNLLTGTNQELLVNVTRAVGECAEEPDNMVVIDRLDGVRLLWSLLKNQNPRVQASAAWAICPCIENAKDAGEMVRSFVGGLELIVSLLKSDDMSVLASVCAAIGNIAKDEENLAVITDHGVVPMLAALTNQPDHMKQKDGHLSSNSSHTQLDIYRPSAENLLRSRNKLRQHLAEAIARCCNWGSNRVAFGQENAVSPLVKYLKCKDEMVHRSTARALFQLSKNPQNCITMHEAGVVKPLMEMVGSKNADLQEAAAGCIGNIRRLALANEKARFS